MRRKPTKVDSLRSLRCLGIESVIDVGVAEKTKSLMTIFPDAEHILVEREEKWHDTYAATYAGIRHRAYCFEANATSWVDAIDVKGPVLIKVDVDGGEMDVLYGCNRLFPSTAVIVVEVTTRTILEVMTYLERHRFKLYDIVEVCYCANQMHQCDMVYVGQEFAAKAFAPWDIKLFQQADEE